MTDVRCCMPMAMSLSRCRRVLSVLLMAFILLQTVGVMHRVAHAHLSAGALSQARLASAKGDASLLSAIWGDHSNSAECQLFDQVCPDLLDAPAWALPAVSALPAWEAADLRERFALFERFYAARGPPAALL